VTNTDTKPESRIFTASGLRLHYLDWGNAVAPTLVCVHGFRGNAHAFNGFAGRFRDRFHVICPDVRGRGDSDWAPDGEYSMSAYVADLAGLVDSLELQRLNLVGTSMGGRIAMHYAAKHAGRLERLVLNDIGPESEVGSDRITDEAGKTPDDFATLDEAIAYRVRMNGAMARMSPAEQREAVLTHVRQAPDGRWLWKNDPAFLRQRVERGAESYPHLWEVLARLQCPTLLVWGADSDVLSVRQARRVVETLPNGELVAVPDVGHAPTLMEPAAVAALDSFFLRAATPA
jgi:pimeloyl-ACP methyl ester carboxylesterase